MEMALDACVVTLSS